MGCRCSQRGAVISRAGRAVMNGQYGAAVKSGKLVASSIRTDAINAARNAAARIRQQRPK